MTAVETGQDAHPDGAGLPAGQSTPASGVAKKRSLPDRTRGAHRRAVCDLRPFPRVTVRGFPEYARRLVQPG